MSSHISAEPLSFQEAWGPPRARFQGSSMLPLPSFAGQRLGTGVLFIKPARCPRHLMCLSLTFYFTGEEIETYRASLTL